MFPAPLGQDSPGRQFLNVVDLEEEEESPLRGPAPGSRPRSQQDIQHPAPSAAQLHLIAAAVVSNAAAAGTRTSDTPAGEMAETVPPPGRALGSVMGLLDLLIQQPHKHRCLQTTCRHPGAGCPTPLPAH